MHWIGFSKHALADMLRREALYLIRKMSGENELNEAMEIWLSANISAHSFIEKEVWVLMYQEVKEALPGACVYVYLEGGKVLGFIGIAEGGYVAGLFVRPDCQSKGIGRALVSHCKAEYDKLWLHVFTENENAVRFYRRNGFEIAEKKESPYFKRDEYRMEWVLKPDFWEEFNCGDMDWVSDVEKKLKSKNKVLIAKDSPLLSKLNTLILKQKRKALALWAFELADGAANRFREKYPDEGRLLECVDLCRAWARGDIKMPVAKRAILNAHAVAKEISNEADIAICHAVGQACSVVHTEGHALGFPIYDLTAIIKENETDNWVSPVEERVSEYITRLLYWQDNYESYDGTWAAFM